MPIYEFRCNSCGWIEEELLKVDEHFSGKCPMLCKSVSWTKVASVPQMSERVRSDSRFPHATHMREPCVHMTKHGPVAGTKRIVAKSRSHMESLMKKHGYVHYATPVDGGSQTRFGQMPAEIKKLETENPMVRKYLDMKAEGRIPSAMLLTDDQLKERFHVDADS